MKAAFIEAPGPPTLSNTAIYKSARQDDRSEPLWAAALPGRQNNGVRLRSEPLTTPAAAVADSGTTPISRCWHVCLLG